MSRFRRRTAARQVAEPSGPQQAAAAVGSRLRHAIFYDVENTSSPDDVGRVVAMLDMDRTRCDTQLVAVGNWRVIGQETARLLARQGAELVHSAPSTGVRDWSDLRIAVDAGIWLGAAKPGDMLDVVSDDQAFDAVGDVAATLGVRFRRIPTRERAAAPQERARGGRGRAPTPHGKQASHEDILATISRLIGADPSTANGSVTLDALSNALKDAGFVRAPGSFRLITRLRRMKELHVGADGSIRLASPEATAVAEAPASSDAQKPRRRRGRRGGRRRGGHQRMVAADEPAGAAAAATQPEPAD